MPTQLFGPYTPVSGTVQKIPAPQDTVWLYVYNDSPLSLLVQYDGLPPSALTSPGGAYNFAVRPHSDPVLPVQKAGVSDIEREVNGIAQFQGVIYIMPRDPGGLASNGSISTRAEFFVVVGGPYDAPPIPSSTQRQTDLVSQARVVAVPPVQQASFSGGHNMSTGNTFNFVTANATDGFNGLVATGYLHSWHVMITAAGVQLNWAINLIGLDGGSVVRLTQQIAQFWHYGQGSHELVYFQPKWAQMVYGPFGGNTIVTLQFQWQCISISTPSTGCAFEFGVTLDNSINNQVAVPPIGGGVPLGNPGGIPLF